MKERIAIIGCGNLGLAILNGLLANPSIQPEQITVTKRNTNSINYLAEKGVTVTSDNSLAIKHASLIICALKPYVILDVLNQNKHHFVPGRDTLISVATGVTTHQLKEAIQAEIPIYRAMPNTAADVGESLTCIASSTNENKNLVVEVFNSIGKTIEIDEQLMESATVLGACGIAYALRFIRGMIQGGIQIGFDATVATEIVNQTVKGATELLIQRQNHPEEEIDKVTTPRGCTIRGLNEMEHHGFSSALIKGINSSFEMIEKQ